jgi:hypothetical protein
MSDKPKPKRDNTPKLGPEDFYVPPGMDVLNRLVEDVNHGLAPSEKPPSYSRLGIAVRDYVPGQPLKQGRIRGTPPRVRIVDRDPPNG